MNAKIGALLSTLNTVILGKPNQVKLAVACLLAKGHLLIEDLPGMGKTTLSHALAQSAGLSYNRVQFTSDLLPADIVGVSIFDTPNQTFVFHKGPIFTQVLLADEINRASPKTQSALLEAMSEEQVSVDGQTYILSPPFFVIATQNPEDQAGTFSLPESQLDRFLMRIELGFPGRAAEKEMLQSCEPTYKMDVTRKVEADEVVELQSLVAGLYVSDALFEYVLSLVTESRVNADYPRSLSPRASKAIVAAAKAWAFIEGRTHVLPDDVQSVFAAVTEHRLRSGFGLIGTGHSLSATLLKSVPVVV